MEEDEDGNVKPIEIPEEQLDDVPINDQCLQIINQQNGKSLLVSNEAAGRVLRSDLIKEMQATIDTLRSLDLTEFNIKCDKEAMRLES